VAFAGFWQEAEVIREQVVEEQSGAAPEALAVELALPGPAGPLTVRGAVGELYGGTLLRVRPGKIRAVDRLSLWVDLLLLSAGHPGRVNRGVFVGKDSKPLVLNPVANAAGVLAGLLAVFWEGLHGFIPFAPRTSEAFAEAFCKGGDTAQAMRKARDEWVGDSRIFPESDDFCLRLAMERLGVFAGEGDAVHDGFARLARTVFEPMLGTSGGKS
jgi:exodeoxyribonuclease V gamma subunit